MNSDADSRSEDEARWDAFYGRTGSPDAPRAAAPALPDGVKIGRERHGLLEAYLARSPVVDAAPRYMAIETTNRCNLACVMCPRPQMTRPVGTMDFDLFRRIIDQIAGRVEFVYLHLFGEPFILKNITDYIDYASGKGTTVGVSTNASFLRPEVADRVLDAGLDMLILSLDGVTKEVYERLRVGAKFEDTRRNLESFFAAHRRNSRLNLCVQFLECDENRADIRSFIDGFPRYPGASTLVKPMHSYAGHAPNVDEPVDRSVRRTCVDPWLGMTVTWDGIVVPCCNDVDAVNPLGDLNRSTVPEVWNSPSMQDFRRAQAEHRQEEIPLCCRCPVPDVDRRKGVSLVSVFDISRHESTMFCGRGIYDHQALPGNDVLWALDDFDLLVQDRFRPIRVILSSRAPCQVAVNLYGEAVGEYDIGNREVEIRLPVPGSERGRLLRYEFTVSGAPGPGIERTPWGAAAHHLRRFTAGWERSASGSPLAGDGERPRGIRIHRVDND